MKILKIIILCGVVLLGYYAQGWIQSDGSSNSKFDLEKYCFLSTKPCQQDSVVMTLEHDTARPLIESKLTVQWDNASSDTLMLEIEGLEMDMGISKFLLKKQTDGSFLINLMLPVCVQDEMTWLGRLTDGTRTVYPAIRMAK